MTAFVRREKGLKIHADAGCLDHENKWNSCPNGHMKKPESDHEAFHTFSPFYPDEG